MAHPNNPAHRIRERVASAFICFSMLGPCSAGTPDCVPPQATTAQVRALSGLPGSGVVDAYAFYQGVALVLVEGNAYWQHPSTCQWEFVEKVYDPSFYENTFFINNGQWYHRYDNGVSLPISTEFTEGFETGSTVGDLLPPNARRWTWLVLLSPQAPNVPAYNALATCLRAGTCDFLDNRVNFVSGRAHSGNKSLRFYAVPPSEEMVTSKSLLDRGLVFFRKGDHAWYSGWYFAQGALPFTLLDFETSGMLGRPGFRITLRAGALGAELKWLDKPTYLQDPDNRVLFPSGQWVNVRVHVQFSEDELGQVEIWQDGVQVLSQHGRTLPTADTVMDYMQVGITATPQETILFVDDILLSATSNPADLHADGTLNFFDVSAFLTAFNTNNPAADFTNDGNYNFFDVSAFLAAFAAGHP